MTALSHVGRGHPLVGAVLLLLAVGLLDNDRLLGQTPPDPARAGSPVLPNSPDESPPPRPPERPATSPPDKHTDSTNRPPRPQSRQSNTSLAKTSRAPSTQPGTSPGPLSPDDQHAQLAARRRSLNHVLYRDRTYDRTLNDAHHRLSVGQDLECFRLIQEILNSTEDVFVWQPTHNSPQSVKKSVHELLGSLSPGQRDAFKRYSAGAGHAELQAAVRSQSVSHLVDVAVRHVGSDAGRDACMASIVALFDQGRFSDVTALASHYSQCVPENQWPNEIQGRINFAEQITGGDRWSTRHFPRHSEPNTISQFPLALATRWPGRSELNLGTLAVLSANLDNRH